MSFTEVVLALHIVVFAAWFGTDLATFTISRRVVDGSVAPASRLALAQVMMKIEVVARLSLPIMLATGLYLARHRGWVVWPTWVVAVVLVAGVAWSGLVWAIYRGGDHGVASTLARVDFPLRIAVAGGLWIVGLVSLVGDRPVGPNWLAVKVLAFATIVTCGLAIRVLLRPFGPAFGDIVTNGSTPERERRLTAPIRRAQPLVAVIWCSLLVAVIAVIAKF